MIFVTVGTQFPFDRLIEAVDAWSAATGQTQILAQTGVTQHKANAIETVDFLEADACHNYLQTARLVVCHAGMGTVLTCLTHGTPVIVMPRLAELGEHRNNHQLDTVKWMRTTPGVTVVDTVEQLREALDAQLQSAGRSEDAAATGGSVASAGLLRAVERFVDDGSQRTGWFATIRRGIRDGLSLLLRPLLPEPKPVSAPRETESPRGSLEKGTRPTLGARNGDTDGTVAPRRTASGEGEVLRTAV
jgi:UDP-N-acetylglucosamine transferase subunit ALG13